MGSKPLSLNQLVTAYWMSGPGRRSLHLPPTNRRHHDNCPVRSIAASEVEALVLGQVRRLLASPELIGRTIVPSASRSGCSAAVAGS
jgi:hypothetical protein